MNTIESAEKTAAEQVAKEKDAVIRAKEETIREKEEIIREDRETIRKNEETILEQKETIRELLKNAEAIAVNLLKTGVSPETVSTSTGLDIRRVNEIFESLNHANRQ
jgi:hypothetical protein